MLPRYSSDEERRAAARHADKLRKMGKPPRVLPEEREAAIAVILMARAAGMDDAMIGHQVGLSEGAIYKARSGRTKSMHRTTYEGVMRLRPELIESRAHDRKGKVPEGTMRDASGTQRRMQALRADGFPGYVIGEILGVTQEAVSEMARRPRPGGVYYTTYAEIKEVYEKLAGTDPRDHGVAEADVRRAQTWAAKAGYAPSRCWDVDTIDDPDAYPDWTGACNTPEGRAIHKRDGIPMCAACRSPKGKSFSYGEFDPDRMRFYMKRKGLTQNGLADRMGLSWQTVQAYQVGKRVPPTSTLERMAEALGVRPEMLVKDAG